MKSYLLEGEEQPGGRGGAGGRRGRRGNEGRGDEGSEQKGKEIKRNRGRKRIERKGKEGGGRKILEESSRLPPSFAQLGKSKNADRPASLTRRVGTRLPSGVPKVSGGP